MTAARRIPEQVELPFTPRPPESGTRNVERQNGADDDRAPAGQGDKSESRSIAWLSYPVEVALGAPVRPRDDAPRSAEDPHSRQMLGVSAIGDEIEADPRTPSGMHVRPDGEGVGAMHQQMDALQRRGGGMAKAARRARRCEPRVGEWPRGHRDAHRFSPEAEASAAFYVRRAIEEHRARVQARSTKNSAGADGETARSDASSSAPSPASSSVGEGAAEGRASHGPMRSRKPTKQAHGAPLLRHRDGVRLCTKCRARPAREPAPGHSRWQWCVECSDEQAMRMVVRDV